MKIKIGKYCRWVGPYQIAEKIVFWNEDKAYALGRFLSTGSFKQEKSEFLFQEPAHLTWFHRLLDWIHSKKQRKVKIHIDNYDAWNADETLSLIILPLLKKVRAEKQGAPFVDDDDVPENLRSTNAPPKEHEWDIDEHHHSRWDWVINEMVWAFEQLQPDFDWEEQYQSGTFDFRSKPCEDRPGYHLFVRGPNHTFEVDEKARKAHSDKIQNGLRLFAKYFQNLST